ncbi:MAG: ATP-binding protein [Verrucomicrobiota bacterium]
MLLPIIGAAAQQPEVLTSLAALRAAVAKQGSASLSFDLQGMVCDANGRLSNLVIQDASATVLLELPEIPANLRAGMVVKVEGRDCWANRGVDSIRLGTAPLLEIDGIHGQMTQKATVTLNHGDQPFRLEWFNGDGDFFLNMEVEGENLPRAKIPVEWFRRSEGGAMLPGLDYRNYTGDRWYSLPPFHTLKPVKSGTAGGLEMSAMIPRNNSAVVFDGFIRMPKAGRYDFYLTTDDGGRAYLGTPNVTCRVTSPGGTSAMAVPTMEAPAPGKEQFWGTGEGRVVFAGRSGDRMELELSGTVVSTRVTLIDPQGVRPQDFLGKTVRVTGLKSAAGILVLKAESVEIAPNTEHSKGVITTADEIHRLRPEEAAKELPVRLVGVVTMVSPQNIVLQDSSGGVYVRFISTLSGILPKPKEIWEVEGITDDGDFSPMVHTARLSFRQSAELPKGVKPTRGQFADGSLDAEQVEIDGIVASSSPLQLELLTQEGSIFVKDDVFYPLPTNVMTEEEHATLVGSVVNLRGVYTATWDDATRRVNPSHLRLGNAILSVTSPAPQDPFGTDLIKPSDLLMFNSETRAFQRVKVAGMILCRKGNELFVNDGKSGFRVISRNAGDLRSGDRIEAVGFPRLEGSSPILLQSQTRKTGAGPLPKPIALGGDFISNPQLDSTRVSIRGTLVSDTKMESSRTLELEKGSVTFLAHVPIESNSGILYRKGSLLHLTGVYVRAGERHTSTPVEPFEIEVGEPDGIRILWIGPWWTPKHTYLLIFILCGLLLLTSIGVTLLRRTVVKRTREIEVHIHEREIIERQQMLDQERSRVAQDLHDELGAGLTEAGILASLANNPSIAREQKQDYLQQLGGVCRTLVTGLDEIVWAVNPNYDAVADLAGYFSLFAQKFLHLADIGCRLNIPEVIPPHRLGSEERHGIFLAFKEALNNIVKHSHANVVHLTIEIKNKSLFIILEDDGRGFDFEAEGDGLGGMENRAKQFGGKFHLHSRTNEGTTVTFEIPL